MHDTTAAPLADGRDGKGGNRRFAGRSGITSGEGN
jgi:hypothetical protein